MGHLVDVQQRFTGCVGIFLLRAGMRGYTFTLGEAYRPPELARLYAAQGRGIANSNHTRRLAIDLNVFKEQAWLKKSEEIAELGVLWETLDADARWGGRFGDGNHFSFEWEGVK